jgi:hypothetical protein
VSFVAITFHVASQRMFIVVSIYFVIDSVRKLLDRPSYTNYKANCRKESFTDVISTSCKHKYIELVSL